MKIWTENTEFFLAFYIHQCKLAVYFIHNRLSMSNYSIELLVRKKQVKILNIFNFSNHFYFFLNLKALLHNVHRWSNQFLEAKEK